MKKLAKYNRKRNFKLTPEPAGKTGGKHRELSFVIQKHAARRLHYDFRLELDGVLKSWAVPKGPDPDRKALAVEVEDHPLEYGKFEGVIPQGQYGGGTVEIWDHGTWQPLEDPHEAFRRGKIRFELHGERLNGTWTLVRFHEAAKSGGKHNWLLMKTHDENEPRPKSSSNGRHISSAKLSSQLPRDVRPQLATWIEKPPQGEQWLHEVKFDGYRLICYIDDGKIELITRGGKDWTEKFRRIADDLKRLPVKNAIVDGEAVALDEHGRSDFQSLQNTWKKPNMPAPSIYLFDLLYLNGKDLRHEPLIERKEQLQKLFKGMVKFSHVKYTDHVKGRGDEVIDAACKMSLEGIVSKRSDATYQSGRTTSWLKSKCGHRQEFVIVGWSDPQGSREDFGSLLLGYHKDGKLQYAGRVGTGFDRALLRDIKKKLDQNARPTPATNVPASERRDAHWVAPKLVAEIKFAGWTDGNHVRQAAFLGLREDKAATEVVREDKQPQMVKKRVKIAAKSTKTDSPRLSHPDKLMFVKEKISKADLAAYYEKVADRMLPHVIDRPLTLVRCPGGADAKCFVQRNYKEGMPEGLENIDEHVVIQGAAGLVALVQIAALEIHAWGSTIENLEKPDRLVFDLDPNPDVPWKRVIKAAQDLRDMLQSLKLRPFVKTTGGKGLHVVVPIEPTVEWPQVKQFCRSIAEEFMRRDPKSYTTNIRKAERTGKIFLDYLRNGREATAVMPYSVRARPGAPISMPITWAELPRIKSGNQFTVKNVSARLAKPDPWAAIDSAKVDLHKVIGGKS